MSVRLSVQVVRVYRGGKWQLRLDVYGVGHTYADDPAQVMAVLLEFWESSKPGFGDVDEVVVDWAELSSSFCCLEMHEAVCRTCDVHWDTFACPDQLLMMTRDGAFGLVVHDGGRSLIMIQFCPFCGRALHQTSEHDAEILPFSRS